MTHLRNQLHAELTTAQLEAVTHIDGPLLILAGPGSGKTRVVTHRVANLLEQGVYPSQILALTFTNKAASEMSNRVQELAPGKRVWMSTFHRFGARMLREYGSLLGIEPNFTIYDTSDSRQVLKRAIAEKKIDTQHYTPDRIASTISKAKNNLLTVEQYKPRQGSPLSHFVAELYPAYQTLLRKANAVDFDDLLLGVAELLFNNPLVRAELDERFKYVLVDEYQDTNKVQYVILRALSVDYPNLAATGDPDQSIYGWRGANLSNILEFENDFPAVKVVRLEENYRSTKRILHVADTLISFNKQRKQKALFTDNDEGPPVRLVRFRTGNEEAENIAQQIAIAIQAGKEPKDFAVFFRMNALTRAFEAAFRAAGVPYQVLRAQEFFHRKEIKDILAYCQIVNNPRDDIAFFRTVNTPARAIGKKTLAILRDHAMQRGLTMLQAAREAGVVSGLTKRAAIALAKYVALVDRLGEFAHSAVEEILGNVLDATGYRKMLSESDSEDDINRLANIEELLTDARQFDEQDTDGGGLEAYLERLWLVNDVDDWDAETNKVSLMTLHAAKGLEFPIVFMPAVEQGVLPHERSTADPVQLEEERRLAFVGITRAEQELQISYAAQRDFRGQRRHTVPSTFLMEMPRDAMHVELPGTDWNQPESDVDWEVEAYDADIEESEYVDAEEALEEGAEDVDEHWLEQDADDFSPPDAIAPKKKTVSKLSSIITTGAALAGEDKSAEVIRTNPDAFAQGMAVIHPEYGPGKIVSLSGSGDRRRAVVRFATAGEKRFMLAHSPLRPVGKR